MSAVGGGNIEKMRLNIVLFLIISISAAEALGFQSASEQNRDGPNQEDLQDAFKISVDVDLVTTDVTVIGSSTSQLKASDFIVYDNGIAQQVTYFSYDLLPVAIALLIDGSGSVAWHMPMLKLAALLSLRHLRPEDRIALFAFDKDCSRLVDLTHDRVRIAKKLNDIKGSGGTDIYRAIYKTARYLREKAPDYRRAIILISDNCQDTYGSGHPKKAQDEVLESAATLYSIRIPIGDIALSGPGPGNTGNGCSESNETVKTIAGESGGDLLEVGASSSLQRSLEKAILNLRCRYTLGFNPSNPGRDGSFHKLVVRLAAPDRCPECQLLVRSGYSTGISTNAPPRKEEPPLRPTSMEKTDQTLIQRSILTAASFAMELHDIPFTAEVTERKDSTQGLLLVVDFHIDSAGIEIKKVDDQHECNLHIAIFYADKNGKIIDYEWKKFTGLMDRENYDRIIKGGIQGSAAYALKPNVCIVKIVVYDEESNKIGSKLIELTK